MFVKDGMVLQGSIAHGLSAKMTSLDEGTIKFCVQPFHLIFYMLIILI